MRIELDFAKCQADWKNSSKTSFGEAVYVGLRIRRSVVDLSQDGIALCCSLQAYHWLLRAIVLHENTVCVSSEHNKMDTKSAVVVVVVAEAMKTQRK